MTAVTLEEVAARVVRRAQRQGFVIPREVSEELTAAGLDADRWSEVIALAGAALELRRKRYHYVAPVTNRLRAEQSQQNAVQEAVREVVRRHQEAARREERRGEGRVEFVHPVKVVAEDGREFTLLTRDLSSTGVRLIGTRRLLGQKVRVLIPGADGRPPWEFQLRVLWTCPVGEDLVENGGSFLGVTREG